MCVILIFGHDVNNDLKSLSRNVIIWVLFSVAFIVHQRQRIFVVPCYWFLEHTFYILMRVKANLLFPSLNTTFYQALSLSCASTIQLFRSSSFSLFPLILLFISIFLLLPSPASLKQYRPSIDPMSLLQHEWGGEGEEEEKNNADEAKLGCGWTIETRRWKKRETIERWWRWWCRENSRIVVVKQRGKTNQGDVRRREG